MQIETNKLNNQMANLTDMLAKFVTANTASTSGSRTLPGNTVTNPREDLKVIYYAQALLHLAYPGPPIPTFYQYSEPIPELTPRTKCTLRAHKCTRTPVQPPTYAPRSPKLSLSPVETIQRKSLPLMNLLRLNSRNYHPHLSINPEFFTHKILMEEDYHSGPTSKKIKSKNSTMRLKRRLKKLHEAGFELPYLRPSLGYPDTLCTKKKRKDCGSERGKWLIPTALVTGC
ncbi:hypothetical protein Tco_1328441 [Tanacetum coccineum]